MDMTHRVVDLGYLTLLWTLAALLKFFLSHFFRDKFDYGEQCHKLLLKYQQLQMLSTAKYKLF